MRGHRCGAVAAIAVLAVALTTACDPAPEPEIPVPTTTTSGLTTLQRERPDTAAVDPIIPQPLEWDTSAQPARLDSAMLTTAEIERLGLVPRDRRPVDSFMVPQRCGRTPVDLGPNGFAALVRTQESHGSVANTIQWRQDIASVHPAAASRVIAAVADTTCGTYPNMYGRYLHDYGTLDLGDLPGADAAVAFCWGSGPRRPDAGSMCVLLLRHDHLLVQLSVVAGFAAASGLMPRIARAVALRLATVTNR